MRSIKSYFEISLSIAERGYGVLREDIEFETFESEMRSLDKTLRSIGFPVDKPRVGRFKRFFLFLNRVHGRGGRVSGLASPLSFPRFIQLLGRWNPIKHGRTSVHLGH